MPKDGSWDQDLRLGLGLGLGLGSSVVGAAGACVGIPRLVLRLAVVRGFKYKKIREITSVSERTIKRICALHRRTGGVDIN